jgi:hypothetical protein
LEILRKKYFQEPHHLLNPADPKFGFFYNSTGNRKDVEVDNQKLKIPKNDSPVIPGEV